MKRSIIGENLPKPLPQGLRARVTLGVVLPLLVILGIFTAIEYVRRQEAVLDNLSVLADHSGQVVEASLSQAMIDDNFAEVQALLDAIGTGGQFRAVYLLDTEGEVIFAPYDEGKGIRLDNQQPDCAPCHSLPASQRPGSVVVTADDGQRVFRSMQPIENGPACVECHDADDRLLGLLLTDIPIAPLEASVNTELRENLLWWLGTILVTVLVVNIVLNRFVLRRLEGLATAIVGLGEGRPYAMLPEEQPDEIGQLGAVFNLMARQVQMREQENRELSERLHQQSHQRGELLKRLIDAQESERKRVARELHDELGQSLGGLALQAKVLERFIDAGNGRTHEHLEAIHTLIEDTTDRMYDLILDLRPSVLDDLGLAAALRTCGERLLGGTDINFELDTSGLSGRLPPSIETTLYRVFQEAMNNVLRHAQASRVHIALRLKDQAVEGSITDDGRGFELDSVQMDGHSSRGIGLLGMQERIAQCCGQLDILSKPGDGTIITVHIPLDGEAACD